MVPCYGTFFVGVLWYGPPSVPVKLTFIRQSSGVTLSRSVFGRAERVFLLDTAYLAFTRWSRRISPQVVGPGWEFY